MTLAPEEFMRRCLLLVLAYSFHRARYYGLLSNGRRREDLGKEQRLLSAPPPEIAADLHEALITVSPTFICPC